MGLNQRRFILISIGALLAFGVLVPAAVTAQQQLERPRFHHVHLNVTDPEKTMQFYSQVFGAVPVKFRDTADALFTERSFILLKKVGTPPVPDLDTGIWHIGWAGVDVPSEYDWWKAKGIQFQTPVTILGRNNYYLYIYGPDKELIEIYSGEQNHRYNHVHLFSTDVNKTAQWFADTFGIPLARREVPKPTDPARVWATAIRVDNVTLNIFAKPDSDPPPTWWPNPPLKELKPTRDRPIDHIAFSYKQIEPVYERMKNAGVRIVEPIAMREDSKLKSFFVLSPDNVLVEVVEARPIPEGLWEK